MNDQLRGRCPNGTKFRELLDEKQKDNSIAAIVNNKLKSLDCSLKGYSDIKLLSIADSYGWRIYQSSLLFLLSKVVKECFPENILRVNTSAGDCFYCTIDGIDSEKLHSTLLVIESTMRENVKLSLPIHRKKFPLKDLLEYLERNKRLDEIKILKFHNKPSRAVYICKEFIDLDHGTLVDNTSELKDFKIIECGDGFMLQAPKQELPPSFSDFKPQRLLFNVYKEFSEWSQSANIKSVGDINEIIFKGDFKRIIDIEESGHEQKIKQIGNEIVKRKEDIKWVLIGGPSAAGKTAFAKRLSNQMKTNGISSPIISIDNYLADRANPNIAENNDDRRAHLEAIDFSLLYEDMEKLNKGLEVFLPSYDYSEGRKKWIGNKIPVKNNEIVIVEGINALDSEISKTLSDERIFKIYINILTQLPLDLNTPVSTTDCLLLRTMLRNYMVKGISASESIKIWRKRLKNEHQSIFSSLNSVDIVFNSSLCYELSVLKPLVEPLLGEIKPWDESYPDARRFQKLLSCYVSGSNKHIPENSVIREFICS